MSGDRFQAKPLSQEEAVNLFREELSPSGSFDRDEVMRLKDIQSKGVRGKTVFYDGIESSEDRGLYLVVDSLPAAEDTTSQTAFLRDKETLQYLRTIQQRGCVLLYDPGSRRRKGGVLPIDNPLLQYIREAVKRVEEIPGFLVSDTADFYTVVHEDKHHSDECSGVFIYAQQTLSKLYVHGVINDKELRDLYVFIGEQRAFAAVGEVRIARESVGSDLALDISDKSSKFRVYEQEDINRLYFDYTAWGVSELLSKLSTNSPDEYSVVKSLLLTYASADESSYLSLVRVFKDHFG